MSLRTLIIDDEAPARRRLRSLLAGKGDIEIVGEATNGHQAVELIRSTRPDLVFLDIQMPGQNGFEVIATIGVDAMPTVIFVTAFDEFALDAFDVQAIDYLLKPFTPERLEKAIARARRQIDEPAADQTAISKLLQQVLSRRPPLRRLALRDGEKLVMLGIGEVTHFDADGNYVRVFTQKTSYQLRDSLTNLETQLDPERFARIHRSIIVNLDAVREIEPYFHGDCIIVLKNGERLRASRRYRERFIPTSTE